MNSKYTQGPGPNAYSLPPQVGYAGHDVSKWRNPAYSMGLKTSTKGKDFGPGPAYKVDKMTRFGNAYSPAAPFGQRTGMSGKGVGPGPGAYNPDTKNIGKINHVGGTFGMRPDDVAKSHGPGPNAYNVKDPTLKRQPAFAIMWSIILRKDMMSYDVVPNVWVLSEEECLYPDCGLARTKKMARECTQPGVDWDTAPIEVKKRDVDNFDRGLSDVIRMTLGKSTVTSSENEDRGRGKRKKTNHRLDYDDFLTLDVNDGDAEDEMLGDQGVMTPLPFSGENTPQPKERVVPSFPNLTPLLKKRCYPPTQLEKPTASPSGRQKANPDGCRQKGKPHTCCFENGSVNLEMLGHTLCSLSRELGKINSNLKHLKEAQNAIETSVEILMGRPSSRENGDDNFIPPNTIIEDFPIASMEKFKSMELKLLDRDFLLQCVTFVASSADKTTESRTVCSVMAKVVALEVAVNFTWKGIQRKNQKHEKQPFMHSSLAKVVIAATRRCWVDAELKKIYLSAANWLAQSQAKLDKMGTKNDMAQKHVGPGPNAYNPKRTDNIPSVKFGPPPGKQSAKDTGPGPGAYQGEKYLKFNKKANPPKFAFGVKTTTSPYISPEDNAVCELICRK